MTKQPFRIMWESWCRAGNPRINPPGCKEDRDVLCSGWTRIDALNAAEAIRIYTDCFPTDRVVHVT